MSTSLARDISIVNAMSFINLRLSSIGHLLPFLGHRRILAYMSPIYTKYKTISISLILLVLAISLFFIYRKQTTEMTQADIAKQEAIEVKAMLSKHLVLPEGEDPDIRKINQKLDDPFFANAAVGDYLIIFYKSRIAYTYSPERDIITNAGVVFINPQQATSTKK